MGSSCGSTFSSQESPCTAGGKANLILPKSFTILHLANIFCFVIHLKECAHRFPVPLYGNDGRKQDKFMLTVPQDQLKCAVTLTGDHISQAVICY